MKKIFFLVFILSSFIGFSQSGIYLRSDSVFIMKGSSPYILSGNNELNLFNGTRTKNGAFLQNYNNGRTRFAYAVDSVWKDGDSLVVRRGDTTIKLNAGSIPNLQQVTDVGSITTNGITAPSFGDQTGLFLLTTTGVGDLQLSSGTGVDHLMPQAVSTGNNFRLPNTGHLTDTLATLSDVRAGGGGGGTEDTAVIYGNWVDETFPGASLPTGWTNYLVSPTVSNGLTLSASGGSSVNDGFVYMNTNYTASLNYTQTTDFVLNTAPSVYTDGLFVGRRSANGAQQCQNAIIMRKVDASHWRSVINTFYGATPTAQDSTGAIAMNAGDTFRIYSAWSQTHIYVRIAKLTNGVETETAAQKFKYNYDANLLQQPANTGAVWMGGLGTTGQYKVLHYTETHYDPTNSELLIVGNSIGARYNASNVPSHWSHLAFDKADINWGNTSGGGDRFNEYNLRLNEIIAKTKEGATVLVEGGTNDTYSDIRAQAVPFFDSLIAHNRVPVWLKVFSVEAKDTIAYNICNELGIKIIDARRSNMNPISGEVHPSDEENQGIAYVIQSELPEITKHTGGNELNLPETILVVDTTRIRNGVANRVLIEGATNKLDENANLVFTVNGSNYLGVGTDQPLSEADVRGSVRIEGFTLPASGQALLLSYTGGVGYIYNYNSSGSVYGDLSLGGAGHVLMPSLATGGAAPSTTGTTKMVISDANGLLSFAIIPTTGITADNGLTASTSTNVQLGGTLLANTTINGGGSYWLKMLGLLQSINTGGTGIYGQTDDTYGVYGAATTTGVGVFASAQSSYGISANSVSGIPIYGKLDAASTNTIATIADFHRNTSGTAANGIGGSIDLSVTTANGAKQVINQLVYKLTDAANLTRTSQFIVTGVNSGATVDALIIYGEGAVKLNPITATAASAITAADGMLIYVNSTNGTFTSVGIWARENGTWVKL